MKRQITNISLSPFDLSSLSFKSYDEAVSYFKLKLKSLLPSYYNIVKDTGSNIDALIDSYAQLFAYVWISVYGASFSIKLVPPPQVYEDYSLLLDFARQFPKEWFFHQIYRFLDAVLYVYLHGSLKENLAYALEIFLGKKPEIYELYNSPSYDITYTHTFDIRIKVSDDPYFFPSYLLAYYFLKKMKPAHTLFQTSLIFEEVFRHNVAYCEPYSGYHYSPAIVDCYSADVFIQVRDDYSLEDEYPIFNPLPEDHYRFYDPCGPLIFDGFLDDGGFEGACLNPPIYDTCYVYDYVPCTVEIEEIPVGG